MSLPLLPKRARLILAISLGLLILVGSLAPAEASPRALGDTLPYADKLTHLVAFAALGLVLGYAAIDRGPVREVKALMLYGGLVFYGAILEALQAPHPGRLFELGDVAANAVGALSLFALYWLEGRVVVFDEPGPRPGEQLTRR